MRRYGALNAVRTLIWNTRFSLGYAVGKFTSAKRDW